MRITWSTIDTAGQVVNARSIEDPTAEQIDMMFAWTAAQIAPLGTVRITDCSVSTPPGRAHRRYAVERDDPEQEGLRFGTLAVDVD